MQCISGTFYCCDIALSNTTFSNARTVAVTIPKVINANGFVKPKSSAMYELKRINASGVLPAIRWYASVTHVAHKSMETRTGSNSSSPGEVKKLTYA